MEALIEHRPTETPGNFVTAMAAAACGVSIVTTDGLAGRFGITVSAVASVSAEPPLVLVCINRRSPAAAAVDANGVFAVNLLSAEQRTLAMTFAGRPAAGDPYDFSAADWQAGVTDAPLLSDASAAFECEVERAFDAGTHRIVIGRVLAARRTAVPPLLYSDRRFGRLVALDH